MPAYYETKTGDMLDWICWLHYGQRGRLSDAARQLDPRVTENDGRLQAGIQAISQAGAMDLRGIVEQVLNANPRLAAKGPLLPAGLQITLPELTTGVEDTQVVQLWDD